MRKEYGDCSPVDEELTPAQISELRRRRADLDDATRYILVSQMAPRLALYYDVSEDVYVMNDPNGATLFRPELVAAWAEGFERTWTAILRG